MIVNLTQKEKTLLQDQKSHEEMCIKKYTNYSKFASCSELSSLLDRTAKTEESHLDSINQLLNGQMPNVGSQSGGQGGGQSQGSGQSQSSGLSAQGESSGSSWEMSNSQLSDKDICSDLLMTEKYVSGTYDTAIFEFRDPQIRSILNHIQKEEQQHGESLYKYMESKGFYQAQ